jgi:serine/threonine-protein kinase RsbW
MGKNTGGGAETVDQFLDSSLESVDSAENLVLEVAQKAGFDEEDLHKIGMSVRESMVNAVVHGNQYSAHKKVHVSVSAGPVDDHDCGPGKGFRFGFLARSAGRG